MFWKRLRRKKKKSRGNTFLKKEKTFRSRYNNLSNAFTEKFNYSRCSNNISLPDRRVKRERS